MHKENISDELRRLEGEVVEGERQLVELETELVALKQKERNISEIKAALAFARECQHRLQQDRIRLLSLLQP